MRQLIQSAENALTDSEEMMTSETKWTENLAALYNWK